MTSEMSRILLGCIFATTAIACGCSRGPTGLVPPTINSDAPEAAIAKYDANGNGAIDGGEIAKATWLKLGLSRIDANSDGKVEAAEIESRIVAWRESRVGLMPLTLRISFRSAPLADADVSLEPEPFLGDAIKPVQGKTDEHGVAVMQISRKPTERGVQLGFYRMRISKKSGDKELLPARYNSESELGLEVEPVSASRDLNFALLP